jgi:hypothetical protein
LPQVVVTGRCQPVGARGTLAVSGAAGLPANARAATPDIEIDTSTPRPRIKVGAAA